MARVTYTLEEDTGRKFRVAGTGTTRAEAVAEANAKLALTVGSVRNGTVSELLEVAEEGTANAGTVYSDANLELRNGLTGKIVNVHLENIATSYSDGFGNIDVTNADIAAFATAYRDGQGAGGYEAVSGKFGK